MAEESAAEAEAETAQGKVTAMLCEMPVKCETHCPAESGGVLAGPLLALGALVAVGAAVWVVAQLAPLLVAAVVVVYAAIPVGLFGVWRLIRYGSLRKPARVKLANRAQNAAVVTSLASATEALPAPVKAIGAPVFVVTPDMVLTGARQVRPEPGRK